ncbi:AAA family ATPase [Cellulomonas iranensis]|uniref:AAA family ATPase n=1 Tax=Cellulomonas iranensis TaxID=76862 RepID=UPI0013D657E2|nr:AAA family ATPase [Cellulomonas iranensis]
MTFKAGTTSVRATAIVSRVLDAFTRNRNVLLVGPPGTGKSVALEDLRSLFENETPPLFDPDDTENPWHDAEVPAGEGKVRSLVLHPSFSYEDLVIGLLPKSSGNNVGIQPHVGPLLSLAHFASQPGRKGLLILDEFNRGNAAAAFGDTLALLDTDKRSTPAYDGAVIDTPYVDLEPEVGEEFSRSDGTPDILGPLTSFPDSLYIVAAMNSADRSVAPLDAALRRRFEIVHIGPDYELLRGRLGAEGTLAVALEDADAVQVGELAVRMLESVNERIELVLGRDFLLGHSLLWDLAPIVDAGERDTALKHLAQVFDDRVVATLRLTFTDQDEHLAAVLRVPSSGSTAFARWRDPLPELEAYATRRLVFSELHSVDDLSKAYTALCAVAGAQADAAASS